MHIFMPKLPTWLFILHIWSELVAYYSMFFVFSRCWRNLTECFFMHKNAFPVFVKICNQFWTSFDVFSRFHLFWKGCLEIHENHEFFSCKNSCVDFGPYPRSVLVFSKREKHFFKIKIVEKMTQIGFGAQYRTTFYEFLNTKNDVFWCFWYFLYLFFVKKHEIVMFFKKPYSGRSKLKIPKIKNCVF